MSADDDVHLHSTALVEGLEWMYHKGWASGTGGGLCIRADGRTYYAPSGVHKERVTVNDVFVHGKDDWRLEPPNLKITECKPIFDTILHGISNGAVLHTHSQWAVLAGIFFPVIAIGRPEFIVTQLEMLKGLRGYGYLSVYACPVIENTAKEADLTGMVHSALNWDAHCIMVRDHGAYIWGRDWDECKRHAEVLHWIWEFCCRKAQLDRQTNRH